MTSFALIGGVVLSGISFVSTSCGKNGGGSTLFVPWRTEDLECKIESPISSTREYIWTTDPEVLGGTWNIYKKDSLPPGIILNSQTGQLTGTPTQAGTWKTRFTYSAPKYKINVSAPIAFIVFDKNASEVDVNWAGDMRLDHDVTINQVDGKQIFNFGPNDATWGVREGYNLPLGVSLDSTTGKIYGTPSINGQFEISFECSKDGFIKTISPKYYIYVDLVHTLTFTGTSNQQSTTSNLTTIIKSQKNTQYSFANFIDYLKDMNYSDANPLSCTGKETKSDGTEININGIFYKYWGEAVHYIGTTPTSEYWYDYNMTLVDTIS